MYGIIDLIRLLKSVRTDHHPKLVLQVIKTTLESVGVQSSAVIEGSVILESGMREQVAALESQILELTREIATRRDRITRLNVELAEMIDARDRLADAVSAPEGPASNEPNSSQLLQASDMIAEIDLTAFDEGRGARGGATPSRVPTPRKPRSLPPPVVPPRRKSPAS